jgi:major membrane immunogen (membrane-anchored lipoprotein)
MATQTKKRSTETQVDETVGRIRDLNENIVDSARRAGGAYLDGYERTLKSIADYQEKVGSESQVDWVSTLTKAQADFTRDVTKIYTSAARDLIDSTK